MLGEKIDRPDLLPTSRRACIERLARMHAWHGQAANIRHQVSFLSHVMSSPPSLVSYLAFIFIFIFRGA